MLDETAPQAGGSVGPAAYRAANRVAPPTGKLPVEKMCKVIDFCGRQSLNKLLQAPQLLRTSQLRSVWRLPRQFVWGKSKAGPHWPVLGIALGDKA
jgi:hypothetical protein